MDLQDIIIEHALSTREELYIKILKQCTGRNFVFDIDARNISIIYHELYPGREFIAYQNNLIGEIISEFKEEDNVFKYVQTFVPKTTFS